MKRELLKKLLNNYFPDNTQEVAFKSLILDFIEKNADCFERTLTIGHITASAFLLNKNCSEVLLMHHNKLDNWFQLGGHCDGESDVLNVAIKEAQEESGIENIVPVIKTIFDIDVHIIPGNIKEKEHYHYDIRFLLKVDSNEEIIQNSESKELRWISKDLASLPTHNPSIIRMFNKWLI